MRARPTRAQSLYIIKGRDAQVPLAICLADVEQVSAFGDTSSLPAGLLGARLPRGHAPSPMPPPPPPLPPPAAAAAALRKRTQALRA